MTKTTGGVSVFAPETSVMLLKSKIEATVEQVTVGHNLSVVYTVIYWDGATRKRENVSESEVGSVDSSKQARIGFLQ